MRFASSLRSLTSLAHFAPPLLDTTLQIPGIEVGGAKVLIDGASENSPFTCPQALATFANHSRKPNARLEVWPVPEPLPCELRVHMMLVAMEAIEAGCEIRIDYEHGGSSYWKELGMSPAETSWRSTRVRPPPPAADPEPVFDRLVELRTAAALGQSPPPCVEPRGVDLSLAVPWEGTSGGDARLKAVVPLLAAPSGHTRAPSSSLATDRLSEAGSSADPLASLRQLHVSDALWSLVATHLPGRTGLACKQRWQHIFGYTAQQTSKSVGRAPAMAAVNPRGSSSSGGGSNRAVKWVAAQCNAMAGGRVMLSLVVQTDEARPRNKEPRKSRSPVDLTSEVGAQPAPKINHQSPPRARLSSHLFAYLPVLASLSCVVITIEWLRCGARVPACVWRRPQPCQPCRRRCSRRSALRTAHDEEEDDSEPNLDQIFFSRPPVAGTALGADAERRRQLVR